MRPVDEAKDAICAGTRHDAREAPYATRWERQTQSWGPIGPCIIFDDCHTASSVRQNSSRALRVDPIHVAQGRPRRLAVYSTCLCPGLVAPCIDHAPRRSASVGCWARLGTARGATPYHPTHQGPQRPWACDENREVEPSEEREARREDAVRHHRSSSSSRRGRSNGRSPEDRRPSWIQAYSCAQPGRLRRGRRQRRHQQ